jgi:hypothetical protein
MINLESGCCAAIKQKRYMRLPGTIDIPFVKIYKPECGRLSRGLIPETSGNNQQSFFQEMKISLTLHEI